MYKDIENYIKSCHICITSKPQRIPVAPLQNTYIPNRPGQFISLDFVGPFKNNYHILTAIDHFSKHLRLYTLKNITAMNTVHAMFDYITTFGRPELILTDNGSQLKAHIFEEFHKMLGIKLMHTSVANPQANSVSERINTSIKSTITALMQDGYKFEYAVKIHENLYNNTFHNTIRATPNKVHFGRAMASIIDTFQPDEFTERLDVHQDYYTLMKNLNLLYSQIQDNLKRYQDLQNNRQHPKAKLRSFNINDTVFLKSDNKFKKRMQGPYKIIKKISDVIYIIQLDEDHNTPEIKVHINRLQLAARRKTFTSKDTHTSIDTDDNPSSTQNPHSDTLPLLPLDDPSPESPSVAVSPVKPTPDPDSVPAKNPVDVTVTSSSNNPVLPSTRKRRKAPCNVQRDPYYLRR